MIKARHPTLRTALTVFGFALMASAPLFGLLPGPGGIFVFAAGLAFALQNSSWAKRQFSRAKRRWPRIGNLADRGLRRASARRRRERDAAAEAR